MMLLYGALAADPATPATVLRRLYAYARDHQSPPRRGGSLASPAPDSTLLCALAANPALPEDLRTTLEELRDPHVRMALLDRPGLTPTDAIGLLGDETRLAVLRYAVRVVADPSGDLAAHVMTRCAAKWLYAEIIAATRTSETARVEAALLLAAAESVNTADTKRVVALARRHPAFARYLHAATPHADLRTALAPIVAALDAPAPDTVVPGQVTPADLTAWLAAPDRTAADVVAYVTAEPRDKLVRAAVTDYADPTGQVAAAALAATEARTVTVAVVLSPDATYATRVDAALRLVAAAARLGAADARLGWEPRQQIRLLMATDASFASAVARTTGDLDLIGVALKHPHLDPAAVTAAADVLSRDRTSPRVGLWQWLSVATHPNATLAARQTARAEIAAAAREVQALPPRAQALRAEGLATVTAFADASVAAATIGNAAAGSTIPCAAVRGMPHGTDLPGATALVAAALDTHLTGLDDEVCATVLTALADGFTGTLGDLADTVAGVSA